MKPIVLSDSGELFEFKYNVLYICSKAVIRRKLYDSNKNCIYQKYLTTE